MMSVQRKRELLAVVAPRYGSARGKKRRWILDGFVASTGYDRKYATHHLLHPPSQRRVQLG